MASAECNNVSDANRCHRRYALNVTSQVNQNESYAKYRNDWTAVANATSKSDLHTKSTFTKKKIVTKYEEVKTKDKNGKNVIKQKAKKYGYEYTFPWTLACAEFQAEIPDEAYIKRVTFRAKMRVTSKNAKVHKPIGDFRLVRFQHSKITQETKGKSTGWHNGAYWYVDTSETLSTEWKEYTWSMGEDDLQIANVTPQIINSNFCGIDFIWDKADFTGDDGKCEVRVQWIRMKVEYDMPHYELGVYDSTHKVHVTSEAQPTKTKANKEFKLYYFAHNRTKSRGSSKPKVKIDIPWGTAVKSVDCHWGTYNDSTNVWTVPTFTDWAGDSKEHYIALTLVPSKIGLSHCSASYVGGEGISYWYMVDKTNKYSAYNETDITALSTLRRTENGCLGIDITNVSDQFITIQLNSDHELNGNLSMNWEDTTDGISVVSMSADTVHLMYTTPTLSLTDYPTYHVSLKYCFTPDFVGDFNVTVSNSETSEVGTATFHVEDALPFLVDVRRIPAYYKLVNHRMASEVEINESIFVCVSDEGDKNMIMTDCRLNASIWEDLDYIGCVPLEHLHFDPKSTYKDTLLNSTYKNKRYMGKKLAVDEDITLNVRLHPHQVTTIQGLIDMDKPIPINANHKCFEGDALNHRGWCEIYAIKTEQTGNNPHWYKCDIDVKYLTHNLNTRFKINNSAKAEDYDSKIPSLMTEVWSSGSDLSFTKNDTLTDTDGIRNNETYFVTDTDGTFYYAEDYEIDGDYVYIDDDVRNNFSIANKQHIITTTKEPLAHISNVTFTWSSVLIEEYKENNVSRIIRLKDKDRNNRTVFEYQYDNIQIDEDEVSADIIYRVLEDNDTLIDYNPARRIRFRYNPTDLTHEDDDVFVEEEDVPVGETGVAHYGSTVDFFIKDGTLEIVDMGFNGREIDISTKLPSGRYLYEVEWINNNEDAETSNIDCTFDFTVQNTILTSTYADKFSKLIVSPFPVAKKKVLFTREAQEGTIYYYEDDGEEFSYLVEPYYNYLNGTDLVTSDNISIFNLNYGYEIVYIQNGLVRLGFNRLSGDLYLGKYDPQLDDYVTTHNLHLEKFDDINLNSITDDKIEIQSSDSTFTIYRGHPYIKIKHETEDIFIDTVSTQVWAEGIGDISKEKPIYWSLLNEDNLLPSCVTDKLDSDCVETEQVTHNDRQSTSLEWVDFPSEIGLGETTFTITSDTLDDYSDEISLDDTTCSFGDYTVEFESDGIPTRFENFISLKDVIQTNESTNLVARVSDALGKPVKGKTIYFYEWYYKYLLKISVTKNIISNGESSTIKATLKDTDGSQIKGEEIYFYHPETVDYCNYGTTLNGITTPSGASSSLVDEGIKYTTSTSGEKNIYYNVSLSDAENWELECEIAKMGAYQSIAMYVKNSTTATGCWFAYEDSTGKFGGGCTGSNFSNVDVGALQVGDIIKITYINGALSIYKNDSLIYTKTTTFGGESYLVGHYTNKDREQYVKNVVIKKW